MTDTALNRLKDERRDWRKNHPFGFVAKPCLNQDGSLNYKVWKCRIPGLNNTFWENGRYNMFMIFSDDYPISPPICRFFPIIFHPNVCRTCGTVRSSLLNINNHWDPIYSIRHILLVIQLMLHEPSIVDIANEIAYFLYSVPDRTDYYRLVQWQARRMSED
ncbi:SUMO-conjugating enzyme UBC9-B-like [Myzus persicae]|uniref:SUMO-conjugating enzyme UBC9-B-like n=1 Tax=Myzus persicae TaxID=13164 RepID=UPI000B939E03|nr:SUMO-conjugating enzyme UBC9-B-like [Myzus persicae]